ncbi:hypothetical protein V1478_006495 [Vespula squamosa]|uniref:Uncharacterized protein n=1 Tax=Vespula squamosa TaxID=30214 RepID=A0ABD2B800_VESSQ
MLYVQIKKKKKKIKSNKRFKKLIFLKDFTSFSLILLSERILENILLPSNLIGVLNSFSECFPLSNLTSSCISLSMLPLASIEYFNFLECFLDFFMCFLDSVSVSVVDQTDVPQHLNYQSHRFHLFHKMFH